MTPFFFLDSSSQGTGMTASLTTVIPLRVSGIYAKRYRGGMTALHIIELYRSALRNKIPNTTGGFMNKKFLYSPLSIKSIGENGVFSGYASVFNIVDKQNDLILPGAFKENLNRNKIKLLWQHNPDEPIGSIIDIYENDKAEEAYLMLKTGTINGLSIGYIPIEYDVDHKSGARVLKQVELWEVSLVTFPANLAAQRWNRWAENILYYDKTTANNEVQTDAFKTIDGSVQVDLKPEVVEKESQSVVINKDGGVQTDGVALITEKDDEALEEQLEGINQELELERLQNASLKEENRELRSAIEGLEKSYKGLTEDAGEREEELTKYKQDKKAMQDKVDEQQKTIFDQYMIIREQGEEIEATRKDNESLQAQIIELKSRLKDKEDKLIESTMAKDKNTELENKVSDLGHENKALRLSVNTLTTQLGEMENLGKQLQSVQESKQQLEIDLEGQLKADTKKLQEAKEGQLAKKAGAVSTVSTAKSTLSKLRNLPNKLSRDKGLNNFLSGKNEELKKGFPEFKEKHFCHNVLNETIKSLSNQDDGKFESSKLLELLESNLKQSAREIIEAKVKEVVNEHCNIGKNMGKELRDDTLKAKLSPSVRKCVKKLEFNKQEGVNKIVDSILHSFNSKNNNNNDSVELLKEIVVKELVEARMRFFLDKIQELQLTSSIRDKFLSTDQGMCNQTQGGVNEYQLTEKAKKEYTPNSSMSHTNTVSIHSLNRGVLNKLCQTAFLIQLNFQSTRKENIKLRDG
ncbi:myosin heavy chain, clone 203-like [Euwallacea similis]|uniref:myosin heavy chain, clone 203-like n=1 Tax=Euwallacea similis TaxID=1736056 RepID=UPI00344B53B4